jgi:hypothetical protein
MDDGMKDDINLPPEADQLFSGLGSLDAASLVINSSDVHFLLPSSAPGDGHVVVPDLKPSPPAAPVMRMDVDLCAKNQAGGQLQQLQNGGQEPMDSSSAANSLNSLSGRQLAASFHQQMHHHHHQLTMDAVMAGFVSANQGPVLINMAPGPGQPTNCLGQNSTC